MHRIPDKRLGGLGLIASTFLFIVHQFFPSLAKEMFYGSIGDWLRLHMSDLPAEVLSYTPLIILFFAGVMGVTGWGADITIHRTRPFFRKPKPKIESGAEFKAPSDSWRHVDELALWQIANLWVGQEPKPVTAPGDPAYPILKMLKSDVTNYKLLSVDDSGRGIHIHVAGERKADVDMKTVVKRNTLLHYIESKDNKPDWDFGQLSDTEQNDSNDHESNRIRLSEAAIIAYEQTLLTPIAKAAEQLGTDIEGWYAAAITKDGDVSVYGRRPPSRIHIKIPNTEVQQMFFEDSANVLQDAFDPNKQYVDLEVNEDEFLKRLQAIKE